MSLITKIDEVKTWLLIRPRLLGEVSKPEQKALVEKYKRSLATALGVPVEAIREDVAEKWLMNWMKALVKPEYWKTLGLE
jgi:hypothetical protein